MHLLPHCRIEIFITTAGVVGSNIETQTFFSHFSRSSESGWERRWLQHFLRWTENISRSVRPPPSERERETLDTGLGLNYNSGIFYIETNWEEQSIDLFKWIGKIITIYSFIVADIFRIWYFYSRSRYFHLVPKMNSHSLLYLMEFGVTAKKEKGRVQLPRSFIIICFVCVLTQDPV